jgi:hypothetical protein
LSSSVASLERKLSRLDYLDDREIIIGRNNLSRTRMMKRETLCLVDEEGKGGVGV